MNIGTAYNKLRVQLRDTSAPPVGKNLNAKFVKYLDESRKPPVTGSSSDPIVTKQGNETEEEASEE